MPINAAEVIWDDDQDALLDPGEIEWDDEVPLEARVVWDDEETTWDAPPDWKPQEGAPSPVQESEPVPPPNVIPFQPDAALDPAAMGGMDPEPILQEPEPPARPFDPEGAGYDYETANQLKDFLYDPESKHWSSRDPRTGMLLKGRQHKTWDLLEKGEAEAGMKIYQGPDGRYYSKPDPGIEPQDDFAAINKELMDLTRPVKVKALTEDGQQLEIEESAEAALKEIDGRREVYTQLMQCLSE